MEGRTDGKEESRESKITDSSALSSIFTRARTQQDTPTSIRVCKHAHAVGNGVIEQVKPLDIFKNGMLIVRYLL